MAPPPRSTLLKCSACSSAGRESSAGHQRAPSLLLPPRAAARSSGCPRAALSAVRGRRTRASCAAVAALATVHNSRRSLWLAVPSRRARNRCASAANGPACCAPAQRSCALSSSSRMRTRSAAQKAGVSVAGDCPPGPRHAERAYSGRCSGARPTLRCSERCATTAAPAVRSAYEAHAGGSAPQAAARRARAAPAHAGREGTLVEPGMPTAVHACARHARPRRPPRRRFHATHAARGATLRRSAARGGRCKGGAELSRVCSVLPKRNRRRVK
jgi:hypothetical protein